ncbi:RipA family octameric membrane protein [Cupriavidus necator]
MEDYDSIENTGCGAASASPSISPIDLYKTALNTRNFEINLFWQRCNYFLVLNSALAYAVISLKNDRYLLPVSILGTLVCLLWYRVALGSKYWQERWEFRLNQLETELKKKRHFPEEVTLFSGRWQDIQKEVEDSLSRSQHSFLERIIDRQILSKPSVTQSMIYLVVIFFVSWLILLLAQIDTLLEF